MKKVFAFLLVTALTLTTGITAFAANPTQDVSVSDTVVTDINIPSQDIPQDLKDKIDALKSLRQDAASMREELIDARTVLKETRMALTEGYRDRKSEDLGKIKELYDSYRQNITALNQQLLDLNKQLLQAIKDKDKEKVAAIRDQVQQLKQAIDGKKAEYSSARDELKQEKELMQQLKADYQALKDELKPYYDQAAAIRDELEGQHKSMADDTLQLKTAIGNQDYATAGGLLDNMINLQKEINANLQKLVGIKNSIKEILLKKQGENQGQDNSQGQV